MSSWIKMRNNLWDDPRVSRLCDLTEEKEACVIGGLYWLWAMADEHTEDGRLPGLTLAGIDRKTGLKGFGAALVEIGWLSEIEGGVVLTRFEEHNGSSAKRRATDASRQATKRSLSASDADTTRTDGGRNAGNCGAREEQNREEQKEPTETVVSVVGAKRATTTRGTRLSKDWQLPKPWGDWALEEFPAWTAETVRRVAADFADHWHAEVGVKATKADWLATWRKWCRSDITQRGTAPPAPSRYGGVARDPIAAQAERDAANAIANAEAKRLLFGFTTPSGALHA